jgi:mono/diheme cytochrome c family protein
MKDETLAKILKVALIVGGISAVAPMVSAQGIGVRELQKMMVPTPQKIERGETLYEQNCAACHGEKGQGMANVKLADAPGKSFQTTDLTEANYRYGGGPLQVYNAITYGLEEAAAGQQPAADAQAPAAQQPTTQAPPHPKFQHLPYQSRWDIVHYVRSLGPTDSLTDPTAVVEKARERAVKGVCDEEIKASIADKVAPKGQEQLDKGAELYAQQCVSCHGEKGAGDGPAAGALQPPPRNFVGAKREDYTNSPSPLGIFNTLQQGIEGTSMASYANLSEDELWALTHYTLSIVPDDVEIEAGEEQIVDACRALSAPEKPEAIPVDVAMKALIKDQVEERVIRLTEYGAPRINPAADPQAGQDLYVENCVSCHGVAGAGRLKGPYGAQPPYFYMKIDRLVPAMAGGSTEEFAERSYAGVHATLPSMTPASMLSKKEWRDLHAYVATFDGEGKDQVIVESPEATDQGATPEGAPAAGQGQGQQPTPQQPAEQQPAGGAPQGTPEQ